MLHNRSWTDFQECVFTVILSLSHGFKYWYIDQIKPKNVPLATEKCPICQLTDGTFFSGEWDIFCFLFYIFWFNLINVPIFSIYYTYICSNANNLSEKEPKTPEKPIFLKLILKPWLGITAWESLIFKRQYWCLVWMSLFKSNISSRRQHERSIWFRWQKYW